MDRKFENLTDEEFDNLTDEERRELLKWLDWEQDNQGGLARSRYEIYRSRRNDLCTLRDIDDDSDDCRYFTLDLYDAIAEWIAENGLGMVLDNCDMMDHHSETFAVFVRPDFKETDEILFKLRWWSEGTDRPTSSRWLWHVSIGDP